MQFLLVDTNHPVYEFILTHKLLTGIIAVLLSVIVSAAVGCGRLWLRALAYGYGPMVAAAFYIAILAADPPPHLVDVLSGVLFESVTLVLYFLLFKRLVGCVQVTPVKEANRGLAISLVLQIAFALPIVASGGFGIFSEGSRIEYLYAGSLPKYFTYAGFMVTSIQAALLATRISGTGSLGWAGAGAVLLNLGLSVASGSKGGVFLWMIATAAMVDYRRARISKKLLVLTSAAVIGALVVSSIIIADFFGISIGEFADLALTRFFLNNDARAMAFDLRTQASAETGLLAESFRSLANLFGAPPRNEPLGVLLYTQLLGVTNGSGANTILMALITFYSVPGYATVPAMLASLAIAAVVLVFVRVARTMRHRGCRGAVLTLALLSVMNFSQDFLAFQVVMPLTIVTIAVMAVLDQRYDRPSRIHSKDTQAAA